MNTSATSPLPGLDTPYPLSPGQAELYRTRGHILLRSVASRPVLEAVRPGIERVLSDVVSKQDGQGRIEDYSSLFQQVTNIWRLDEDVRAFVFARRFARIAAELMGVDGVRLYHDQALFKPAGGKVTPWHQDQFYWPLDTRYTITMWMPLIDLTRAMGTMLFAGGSHLEGEILGRSISDESHLAFERLVEERGWQIESYDMLAGDATFHSGWTVHSAHPNATTIVRKVMTIIYFADGTKVAEPGNDFRRTDMEVFLPGCRAGDQAASPLNPLLYRRTP